MRNLLTPASVAATLGISTVALHNWRVRGVGPEWTRRGAFYYYRQDQLQEYLDRLGPIPEGMSPREKHRFFTNANRPEEIPPPVEPVKRVRLAPLGRTVKELAARIDELAAQVAELRANTPNPVIPY